MRRRRAARRTAQATLPARNAAGGRARRRASDPDAADFASISDDEVSRILSDSVGRRPATGWAAVSCLLEGASLGVREAYVDAVLAGMRNRWPPTGYHGISDMAPGRDGLVLELRAGGDALVLHLVDLDDRIDHRDRMALITLPTEWSPSAAVTPR